MILFLTAAAAAGHNHQQHRRIIIMRPLLIHQIYLEESHHHLCRQSRLIYVGTPCRPQIDTIIDKGEAPRGREKSTRQSMHDNNVVVRHYYYYYFIMIGIILFIRGWRGGCHSTVTDRGSIEGP